MKKYVMPIITLFITIFIWEAYVRLCNISLYILPSPSRILSALVENFQVLWEHSMVTLFEATVGLIIATILAILIAIGMDLSKTFKHSIFPHLVVTQTVPVMVLGPLFSIWFGFGLTPKILMVIFMCFFPIVISFSDALTQINPQQINLLKSFGASKLKIYTMVKMPAASTALFSGLKVASTYCIGGAIVGEWLNASAGLGYYMLRVKNGYMLDKVFACVLVIILWSIFLNGCVNLLEKVIFPYKSKVKFQKVVLVILPLFLLFSTISIQPQTQKVVLMLDYVPNTNHTGIYVADKLGYFKEEGIDIQIIEPGSNQTSATMVASGKADFGMSYQEDVTYALASKDPLPIKAIAAIIQHNTSGFVSLKDANINNPKDFEGKVYAGWQAPSEEAVIKAIMEKENADFSKLTMVGADGSGFASFENGIDMMWEFEGWAVINGRLNGYDLNYIPCKDLDERLDYYTPVLITNDSLIESNPDLVQKVVNAIKKGYEYAIENPNEAAQIMYEVLPDIDQMFILESQKYLSEQYSLDSDTWGLMKEEVWTRYTDFMYEYDLINKKVEAKQQYTNEFLD